MKRAFTLIELLVVMGIMGLLGTISVGGYRAMQRGMEERGVMQSVNSFVRTAYQRAQIDRQPVAVYFWNETIRGESDLENEIVVGRAVAVRRHGRFSAVRSGMLIDEFTDLNLTYQTQSEEEGEGGSASSSESSMFVYPMERLSDIQSSTSLKRTLVEGKVRQSIETIRFLTKLADETVEGEDNAQQVISYGFKVVDQGGVQWQPGMAYGMEFQQIELPHNYIFGSQYSKRVENPFTGAGTLTFDVGVGNGNGLITGGSSGRNSIEVSSLRPDGAGGLKAEKVAASDNPERDLN